MIKQLLLSLTLVITALSCTGCATILGGIIGYQSGELAAGMAIGAAVDFGGDIARGVGQMTAKEKDLRRDFMKKSTFDTKKGEITLPICPFNEERVLNIAEQLRKKFEENSWTYLQTEKIVNRSLFFADHWTEKWNCATNQQVAFEFKIDFCSSRDTKFTVRQTGGCDKTPRPCGQEEPTPPTTAGLTPENMVAITSQIYKWIEQIVIPAS